MSSVSKKNILTIPTNSYTKSVLQNDTVKFHYSIILLIIYYVLIIVYITSLEYKHCNCISDWRHNFIKYYALAMIIYSIITINISNKTLQLYPIYNILQFVYACMFLFNIWCLYTYVGDLDKTNCECAIIQQKNTHYFLYIWRYVLVLSLIISLLLIIYITLVKL